MGKVELLSFLYFSRVNGAFRSQRLQVPGSLAYHQRLERHRATGSAEESSHSKSARPDHKYSGALRNIFAATWKVWVQLF